MTDEQDTPKLQCPHCGMTGTSELLFFQRIEYRKGSGHVLSNAVYECDFCERTFNLPHEQEHI